MNLPKRPTMKFSVQNVLQPSTPTKLFNEESENQKDNVNLRNAITNTLVSGSFKAIAIQKNFGKKINTGINWRTALTIGIFSGLLSERIVDAMKILIGFK